MSHAVASSCTALKVMRLMHAVGSLGAKDGCIVYSRQDKFYFVLEGEGEFVVGDETLRCGAGHAIWAPVGVPHGVGNTGNEPLVVLVGIAPAPAPAGDS